MIEEETIEDEMIIEEMTEIAGMIEIEETTEETTVTDETIEETTGIEIDETIEDEMIEEIAAIIAVDAIKILYLYCK